MRAKGCLTRLHALALDPAELDPERQWRRNWSAKYIRQQLLRLALIFSLDVAQSGVMLVLRDCLSRERLPRLHEASNTIAISIPALRGAAYSQSLFGASSSSPSSSRAFCVTPRHAPQSRWP